MLDLPVYIGTASDTETMEERHSSQPTSVDIDDIVDRLKKTQAFPQSLSTFKPVILDNVRNLMDIHKEISENLEPLNRIRKNRNR